MGPQEGCPLASRWLSSCPADGTFDRLIMVDTSTISMIRASSVGGGKVLAPGAWRSSRPDIRLGRSGCGNGEGGCCPRSRFYPWTT